MVLQPAPLRQIVQSSSPAYARPVAPRQAQDHSRPGPERKVRGLAHRPNCKAPAVGCEEGLPWPLRLAQEQRAILELTVERAVPRFGLLPHPTLPSVVALLRQIPSSALVSGATREEGLRAPGRYEEAAQNAEQGRTEQLGLRRVELGLLDLRLLTSSGAAAPGRALREGNQYSTMLPTPDRFCDVCAPLRTLDQRRLR